MQIPNMKLMFEFSLVKVLTSESEVFESILLCVYYFTVYIS